MVDPALARDYGSLDAAGVAALDAAATRAGVDTLQLMEVAGLQVARCAWVMLGEQPGRVLVLAGRGNNGGDGLVAARHLRAWGCEVAALVAGEAEALRGAVATQLRAARGAGVTVEATADPTRARVGLGPDVVVVDALLGTGLKSAPRAPDAGFIRALREHPRILAVDVPSGLDASTGDSLEPCVSAAVTCTLTACKAGLWTVEGRARAGLVLVADIGMPATAWQAAGLVAPRLVRGAALLEVPASSGAS
jgi:hydroxyethylthiazole kinase-like uncharacterized protein yjeF